MKRTSGIDFTNWVFGAVAALLIAAVFVFLNANQSLFSLPFGDHLATQEAMEGGTGVPGGDTLLW